jgi:hypothetical protein
MLNILYSGDVANSYNIPFNIRMPEQSLKNERWIEGESTSN